MNDNRPVNLDLGAFRWPITAIASITHRITGVALFVAAGILLWMLDVSLSGPEGFARIQELGDNVLFKLILWGCVSALIYHSIAGIKHLVMDMGIGETLEGGVLGARLTIGLSIVLILLAGVWIW